MVCVRLKWVCICIYSEGILLPLLMVAASRGRMDDFGAFGLLIGVVA